MTLHDNTPSLVEEGGKEYFRPTETHLLRSNHVDQTFKIQVMLPPLRKPDNRRFPVLYISDGNAAFDMCKAISWLMQQTDRDLQPYILVAIGYPSDSPVAGLLLRGRDLTFPGCPNFFNGHPEVLRWGELISPGDGKKNFCGGEEFQRFIGSELIPFIDERYQTLSSHRTYFGHSMGGGFGLYTLLTQTHLFQNYICSSPTVAYDGETADGASYARHDLILERVQDFIHAHNSLADVRLYLSVGTEEQFEVHITNWQFVSNFYQLAALLKRAALPGISVRAEVFPGETHHTVWPVAFTHGVRAVFGKQTLWGREMTSL